MLAAIAQAPPGGVVFHCVGGRDRTGQISILLLALAGVAPEEIVADYELSDERVEPLLNALGTSTATARGHLQERGTSAAAETDALLAWPELGATLRRGGLGPRDRHALRARLLG